MKAKTLGLVSMVGMLLSGVSAYSLTPAGGLEDASIEAEDFGISAEADDDEADDEASSIGATFSTGDTLEIEGRMGHAKLLGGERGETFMLLEVTADRDKTSSTSNAPVNLALVIDRSGSMKGPRMQNAQSAAIAAIDRLNDGDVASIITFDDRTSVLVPPTTINASTRSQIASSIRGIQLGGDTCLSCGVEDAMRELERTTGKVDRIVVLSDGDANKGVRDVPGFQSMARRAVERGVNVTTIGVSLQYNQKILAALAQTSNGNHYFVENESGLPAIFQAEADSLKNTVASEATATIELAPGVQLAQVFDRTFTKSGNQISVPMGTFARGETKTVLLKLRVDGDGEDLTEMAKVRLDYQDLSEDERVTDEGKLAVVFTDDDDDVSALDPLVLGRVQRSETASALRDANDLFALGKAEEARRRLDEQREQVRVSRRKAKKAAPPSKSPFLDDDFGRQASALDEASSGFATPPPGAAATARPAPSSTIRRNAERSVQLGL